MHDQILELKTRVARLRKKRVKPFGYSGHHMKLRPPIPLEQLESIEQTYHVTLPEDYRQFLLLVGNGGAGPGYGLEDLESAIVYQRELCPKDILSQPFPHTKDYNCYEDPDLVELDQQVEDGFITEAEFDRSLEYLTAGTLVLCHEGCGHLHRLVVTGPTRGDVWLDSDVSDQGYHPFNLNFYQWYNRWLTPLEDRPDRRWFFFKKE